MESSATCRVCGQPLTNKSGEWRHTNPPEKYHKASPVAKPKAKVKPKDKDPFDVVPERFADTFD